MPTRELATQVTEALAPLGKKRGVSVRAVYGGVSMDPQIDALRKASTSWSARRAIYPDLIERKELAGRGRSRCSSSTRPTAWPTWASCRRCRRSSTA
ncbi:MAG: hypothetical protein U0W40_05855 [Acidimicrobiia bacterium]